MRDWYSSPRLQFPIYGFFLGILIWLVDGIIDVFVLTSASLFDVLFFNIPPHAFFLRVLILGLFSAGGYLLGVILHQAQVKQNEYSGLIRTTPDMFWLADQDGRIVQVNDRLSEHLHCATDDLIGRHMHDLLIHDETAVHELIATIFQQQSHQFTTRIQCSNNQIPVEVSASVLPDTAGQIICFARDMSRHQATIQSLKESQQKYQALFEHMNSGFAVHTLITNQDGEPVDYQFLRINDQFSELTGLGPEVIGKTATEVMPGIAEDPVGWIQRYGRVVQMGEPTRFEAYAAPLGKWFAVSAYRSAPHQFATLFEDITAAKEAEAQLRDERQFLHQITETSPVGIVKADANGQLQFANARAEDILGLHKSEIQSRRYNAPEWRVTAVDGSNFSEDLYPFNQVKRAGKPVDDIQHAIEWPDGARRVLSVNAAPLQDADGTFDGMVAALQDITEQTEAQTALQRTQQLLAETQQIARIGGWEVELKTGQQRWTEETYRIHGLPVGADIDMEAGIAFFPGNARDIIHQAVNTAIEQGKSYELELPFIDAAGVRKWVRTLGEPVIHNETVVRLQGTIQDITHEKETEAAQRRIYAAVEQLSEAVVITDTKPVIEYVNPAFEQITGYKASEVIGENPSLLQSGEHDAAFYSELWDTISQGNVWTGTFINQRKDGTLYHEESVITPIQDLEGHIANYVAVKRDITEERQLEEQLRQSQKMEAIGRLSGGVAHDFNNILTVITGYGDLLMQAVQSDSQQTMVQSILTAAERARSLTKQLLTFSRKQSTHPEVVQPNALIEDYLQMLQRLISDDVNLRFTPGEAVPSLWIDPAQLEQVLMNLTVNAQDAMTHGGDIHIETFAATPPPGISLPDGPKEVIGVTVSDTGCGIPAEEQQKIFEPFYTTKAAGQGTGLGLATVYGIVKKYHGDIILQSTQDKGTTFTLYFPVTAQHPATSETSQTTDTADLPSLHILLVDDDLGVLQYLQRVLAHFGCQSHTAVTVQDAVTYIQESGQILDLIITDVVLSDGNGVRLAERCRALYPKMPILYISGYPSAKLEEYGVDSDDLLLEKPFQPAELRQAINALLNTE